MTNPPPKQNVVVLLGAGASKDAGLMLTNELTEDLRTSIDVAHERDLQRAIGLILGAIALRTGIEGGAIDGRVNIETVLKIAQVLQQRDLYPLSWFAAGWLPALEALAPGGDGVVFRTLVNRAMSRMKEVLATPTDPSRVKYLAEVRRLTEPVSGGRRFPAVFTLNYDLCLEMALRYVKCPFTTGFKDGAWSTDEFLSPDRLTVYKLHGSFGWVRHPETQVLFDRDAALTRHDLDIVGPDTPDELVFATDQKFSSRQPFLWMANQFGNLVSEASYVVTIGYSFGDEYINQIVYQAMAADPKKRLLVVDPSLTSQALETATGFTFYPERTRFLSDTARRALQDRDTLLKAITEFEGTAKTDAPF